MIFFNKRHFREFLNSEEGISTNILTDRLNLLENEGIVSKQPDSTHKQKLIYSLTEKGINLVPIIAEIGLWSDKYASELQEDRDVVLGLFKNDKSQGILDLQNRLRVMHL